MPCRAHLWPSPDSISTMITMSPRQHRKWMQHVQLSFMSSPWWRSPVLDLFPPLAFKTNALAVLLRWHLMTREMPGGRLQSCRDKRPRLRPEKRPSTRGKFCSRLHLTAPPTACRIQIKLSKSSARIHHRDPEIHLQMRGAVWGRRTIWSGLKVEIVPPIA